MEGHILQQVVKYKFGHEGHFEGRLGILVDVSADQHFSQSEHATERDNVYEAIIAYRAALTRLEE